VECLQAFPAQREAGDRREGRFFRCSYDGAGQGRRVRVSELVELKPDADEITSVVSLGYQSER
jgi:hypothetical protein